MTRSLPASPAASPALGEQPALQAPARKRASPLVAIPMSRVLASVAEQLTGQAGPAFVHNVEVVDATPRRVILHLRYPIQLLPLLVFESLWKLIWLVAVGVPHLMAGDMDAQMSSVFFSVSLVVIILAVTPWDYVWKQYVRALGAHWR